jgi:hypothetical protein
MDQDEERCMDIAHPILRDMHDGWFAAFAMYREKYPEEVIAEHDDTTTANCIRSHLWTEISRRLYGRPGCHLLNLNRFRVLNFRDKLVWRFKKVNGDGQHRNYQTKQQRDFDDQLPLDGIPDKATRLTSGYQPDPLGQMIERIIVARPIGRNPVWAAQVNVVDEKAVWADITPSRFSVTDRIDFRGRGKGR